MKKLLILLIAFVIILAVLSSCSNYTICPTYSHHNKVTKSGQKAQAHYTKKFHRGRW